MYPFGNIIVGCEERDYLVKDLENTVRQWSLLEECSRRLA